MEKVGLVNVVCFFWFGEKWPEGGNGADYVNKLFWSVKRNLSKPFSFICFTNEAIEFDYWIEKRPLKPPTWKRHLPKLYAFSKDAGLLDRALMLDIDNIITGSLDDIASYTGDFATRGGFRDGKGRMISGDVISFNPNKCHNIFDNLTNNAIEAERQSNGYDGRFLQDNVTQYDVWEDVLPGQVINYKRIHEPKNLPENSRVISCTGHPMPHELSHQWVKDSWR